MRRTLVTALWFLLFCIFAAVLGGTMMEYLTHTLPNGLRMVHLPIQTPVSYCGYAVNAGTRDEEAK